VNKDQVSGKVEQAVGKLKQSFGETVGHEKLANQGVVDQAKGAAKETWGDAPVLPSLTRAPALWCEEQACVPDRPSSK